MQKYTLFDHTADLGVEIFGRTKRELFANAVLALSDILMERREKKTLQGRQKTINVEGSDPADLLINFLREILYLFNGERLVVVSCSIVMLGKRKLVANLGLESYNSKKHLFKTDLKAVTYHGLSVEKTKNGWKAMVIFDV